MASPDAAPASEGDPASPAAAAVASEGVPGTLDGAPGDAPPPAAPVSIHAKSSGAALTLGALGVVFGDIGTSPLYAMKETFDGPHKLAIAHAHVYGVLSLIFWSITIIVSLKYVTFIMRADNDGEGGIMALIAKVEALPVRSPKATFGLVALGIFGAALFYGDGMITPAISVLSAVEGLKLAAPGLADYVVPIAVAILTGLFFIQRFGTGVVGRAFGPVMGLWFGVLGVMGIAKIVHEPAILQSLSPHYAVAFFVDEPKMAFLALASVVLAVTGAEALYADMGHFGRSPIRRAWFLFVMPALFLNYMGQGALLLKDPSAIESPLYRLVPHDLLIPLLVLATAATVIASQAVISGAFSVTRQAVRLGFLPYLTIRHTSRHEVGQIYVPVINWGLYVAILGLVVGFGSSTHLASAYGIAVTGTLAIDTILFFVVVRMLWQKPVWLVAVGVVGFLTVDLAFFLANLTKVVTGGWFPLVIAGVIFVVLMTWRRGQLSVAARRAEEEGSLTDFVLALDASDDPPIRVPGTAVFLNADPERTPLAMRFNVEHNHVLHEQVVVFNVETVGVPHVTPDARCEVDTVVIPDDGIVLVKAKYGFQDRPHVPETLAMIEDRLGMTLDLENASYFLSRVTLAESKTPGGMALWRKRLFISLERNGAGRVEYFGLPHDKVVSFGSEIEV
ncbi:MAG: potassium transporter Kup [Solirubrobacteraceae bacterium]|nr:potassium transporter Kup [Patulibacter sp.]